jgi:putative Ca2+/H+ antiporter (TMEM165/GDT1 family)
MIAFIRSHRGSLAGVTLRVLAAAAFAFLAAVTVGGAAPSLVAAAIVCGVTGAFLVFALWRARKSARPLG